MNTTKPEPDHPTPPEKKSLRDDEVAALKMSFIVGTVTVIKRNGEDGATLEWSSEKEGLLIGR